MFFTIALYASVAFSGSDGWPMGKSPPLSLDGFGRQRSLKACSPARLAISGEVRVYAQSYTSVLSRFRIDGGPQLAATVSVGATTAGPPVFLILAARSDMIWDFRTVSRRRIKGVILLGEKGQAVANLPSNIPVSFNPAVGPNGQCFNTSMLGPDGYTLSTSTIRQLIGDVPYRSIEDRDPAAINIDGASPPRPEPDRLEAREIRASQNVTRDLPAGIAGMIELLKTGAVRHATQADVDAWNARRRLAGLTEKPVGLSSTYVILRATDLPQNGDAFWPKFIVSRGAPAPKQARTYYMLEDGSCTGC